MGESSQTTESQQRQKVDPWGPAKEPLKAAIPEITKQYEQDKAGTLVPQATDYLSGAISGNYLNPSTNPNLGALTKAITDPIQAQLSAQFGMAGRGTSGAAQEHISQGMTSGLAAPLFAQYNTERGLQQQAAQMAPAMQAAGSLPLDQMLQRLTQMGQMGSDTRSRGTETTTSTPSIGQTISGTALTALGMMGGNPLAGLSAAAPQMFGGMTTPAGWW